MRGLRTGVLSFTLAACLGAGGAVAQPAAPGGANAQEQQDAQAAREGNLARFALAVDLHALGLAERDAVLLVAAARLFAAVGLMADAPGAGGAPPSGALPDMAAALAAARDLAGGDAAVLAALEAVTVAAPRGRGGPNFERNSVVVGQQRTYREVFEGGEAVEVFLAGDGRSLLNLEIYDENNNLVCRSRRAGDRQFCRWTPNWRGMFRIVVVNVGDTDAHYTLLVAPPALTAPRR